MVMKESEAIIAACRDSKIVQILSDLSLEAGCKLVKKKKKKGLSQVFLVLELV